MKYCCLTIDIVKSRNLSDREVVQNRVLQAIETTNRKFRKSLVVPFSITLGDEWQGLIKTPIVALKMDFYFRKLLYPIRLSSGIGIGSIATSLKPRTQEMDGPCFLQSREALRKAVEMGGGTVFSLEDPLLNRSVNTILQLMQALSSMWTDRQYEKVMLYEELGTEKAAADRLGVSQSDIHQALRITRGKVYLRAYQELLEILKRKIS